MRFGRYVSVTSALLLGAAPAVAQQSTLAADAAAFGMRDAASHMDLSPDGKRIVYVGPGTGPATIVVVGDLTTGSVKPVLRSSGTPESLSWCAFGTNDRIVCRYSGAIRDAGQLVGFSRMISLSLDGTDAKELGQRQSDYDARIRQFDGSVIDWLPTDNDAVLMTREFIPEAGKTGSRLVRSEDGLGVVRINVKTLKAEVVEKANPSASYYMSDGLGNVRVMAVAETSGDQLTGRTRYYYRAKGSRDWQTLVDYQRGEFIPLAVDASVDSAYVLKKLNGRYALYRVKLDSSRAAELVASHPKVDIDNVLRLGDGLRVIGYEYVDDKRRVVYFDDRVKKLAAGLSKALPNLPLIDFVSASSDGQNILLFAGSDNDPGRYYLYEEATRSIGEVIPARPELAQRKLSPVKPISYPATDGTQIPAYLTLPAGSSGKGLPAVVLPHGGPEARDEWGFDWLAQFLAARGYAVIQPNFRGSGGYGDDWLMENGFKSWRTSIGDVASAARWLGSQGIADPNRMAIVGWSYGGYAALQAAATEPGLFKAVAAVAPVTDLAMLKTDAQGYTNAAVVAKYVGSGPHITEGSPLRRADDIQALVLLIHGDMDQNVGVGHSREMFERLKKAGRSADLLEFKGLDHQLRDAGARTRMLVKVGELLERTIGH